MAEEHMLTTIDNPHNPFTEWDEWLAWDLHYGWNTCGFLARLAATSPNLPPEVNAKELERAMDEAIDKSPYGIHIKVTKDTKIIPRKVSIENGELVLTSY